jgi:hypothetical protein
MIAGQFDVVAFKSYETWLRLYLENILTERVRMATSNLDRQWNPYTLNPLKPL